MVTVTMHMNKDHGVGPSTRSMTTGALHVLAQGDASHPAGVALAIVDGCGSFGVASQPRPSVA